MYLPRFKGLLPVMVKQGYMQQVDVDANISHLYVAAPALVGAKKSLEYRLAAHGLDPQAVFSGNAARPFQNNL